MGLSDDAFSVDVYWLSCSVRVDDGSRFPSEPKQNAGSDIRAWMESKTRIEKKL